MRERRQWVVWRLELRRDNRGVEKWTKVPYAARDGRKAKSNNPSTWGTFDQAVSAYGAGNYNGIGYVFAADDPYVGVDLDKCRDAQTGVIASWAQSAITRLQTYAEASVTGTGVHAIARGELPPGERRSGSVEMYDSGRYFCMSGAHLDGTPTAIEERTEVLAALHRELLGAQAQPSQNGHRARFHAPTDDELIGRMRAAANGAKFARLWNGDTSGYPSQSDADLALANILVWWTDGDAVRADRLFRQSGLMRDKWDERHYANGRTYGQETIGKAVTLYQQTAHRNGRTPGGDGHGEEANAPSDSADGPDFHLTDLGNAERLVRKHGSNVRYCHKWGAWLIWNGRRWRVDENGAIVRLAKDTVRQMYKDAARLTERAGELPEDALNERMKVAEKAEALLAWAKKSEHAQRINAMITLAESEPGIPVSPDDLDAHPWLFNCRNGTLDLTTGALRPHDRADLITKMTVVDYDANAACPTWLKFLADIFEGNHALIEFIRRALGYSLTGDISEQVLFILYGTGQNGKSTLIEAVRALLGDGYAQQADFSSFLARQNEGPRNDLARLFGSRFVSTVEVEAGRRLSEVVVKQLTGGDRITARFLFREFFEYTPAFKLFLACNHKPVIYGTDYAIWRRIRLIPFTVTIPKDQQDKRLPAKLRDEMAGILTWMVRGCLDWQRDGLTEPAEVSEATEDYRTEMDALAGFIGECCIVSPKMKAPASDLYKAYTAYCERNGEEPLKQKTFGLRLGERELERRRDSGPGRIWWHGIGLRADGPTEPTGAKHEGEPNGSNGPNEDPGTLPQTSLAKGTLPKHRSDRSNRSVVQLPGASWAVAQQAPPNPVNVDARTLPDVAALADEQGYPTLTYKPGHSIGDGAENWERFLRRADGDTLVLVLEALQRRAT